MYRWLAALVILGAVASCSSADEPQSGPTDGHDHDHDPIETSNQATPPDGDPDVVITVAVNASGIPDPLGRVTVERNDIVELVVTAQTATEVHIHGYNHLIPVEAGQSTAFRFVADLGGVFEIELEETGAQVATLQVS